MSAISLKSISGITSITSPAAPDNKITLHTQPNTVERLRITSDGKVGINRTDPSNTLDVVGGYQALGLYRNDFTGNSGAGIELYFGRAKANGDLFNCATVSAVGSDNTAQNGQLRFSVLDSGSMDEKLRITSGGQVNIGTGELSQTDRMLNVHGGRQRITYTGPGNSFELMNSASAGNSYGLLIQAGTNSSDYNSTFRNTSGTTLLRIRGDGRIGINNTSPDGNLHVHNSSAGSVTAASDANELVLESAANVGMSFLTANNSLSRIKFGDPDATNAGIIIYSHADDSLRFQHTSNERLRITSAGTLKFTGQNTSLETAGITHHTNNNLYIRGGTSGLVLGNHDSTNTIHISNSNYIKFETNDGTEKLRIKSNGIIVAGNSGTSYGNALIQSFIAHGSTGSESGFASFDTTSVAAGVGGEIAFHGKFNTGAQDYAYLGHIRGIKENATNGNTACALTFHTRPNATAPIERLRITSDGDTELRNTVSGINNSYSQYLKFRTTQTNGQSAVTGQIAGQGKSNWGGDLVFYSKPANGTPNNAVSERLRITSGGNVGIGTDNVSKRVQISGTAGSQFQVHPHAGGFDIGVTSGDMAPHYQTKFVLYNGQIGSGTERFRVSPEGYVTKPNHPGFFAYMDGGNQTTNGGNIIPFNQTHFNTGSHFKTSGTDAYKFVCPVAGIYHFSGAIWMKNSGSGAHARWQIRKNNATQCQAGWHQNASSGNNDFYDHSAPAAMTIYCNAGDKVYALADYTIMYWRGGGAHPHSYFTGHLVG